MILTSFLLSLVLLASLSSNSPAVHLPLYRRCGRSSDHQPANLTHLLDLLQRAENRYCRTSRNIEGNRLVRRWNPKEDVQAMFDEIGLDGRWYTTISVGTPPQTLEVDLDFLNADFYTVLTTSEGGSKFNTFASRSHDARNTFVHPLCRLTSDAFGMTHGGAPAHLDWPICQPPKSSRHTLLKSGTVLGLAPTTSRDDGGSLSRLTAPSFTHLLHQQGHISSPLWSITLLDGTSGIISLGGSLAAEVEEIKIRLEAELKYLSQEDAASKVEEEVRGKMAFSIPVGSTVEDHFKWVDVSGPSGWWTGLMSGVWVNGVKILKNQPFLIDLSCPFIIAPPAAFEQFYYSISGSKPLSPLSVSMNATKPDNTDKMQQTFNLFPCLNPPKISLELAGWPFATAAPSRWTREDAIHGPAGGPFSLGKVEENLSTTKLTGNSSTTSEADADADADADVDSVDKDVNSGFCVGVVVSSDMGERRETEWMNSGMRDTWVLGEPFFRGMGVLFDDGQASGKARIGFRIY